MPPGNPDTAVAKVALGAKSLEADTANRMSDDHFRATDLGFTHGHRHNDQIMQAMDHGHRHGMAIGGAQQNARQILQQAVDEQANAGVGQASPSAGAPAAA